MTKSNILKKLILSLFAFFYVANIFAQLAFKLDVSSHSIGKDEVLQVSYTVQNASELNSGLSLSNFPGWKIVSGPQTSQETSIVNGVRSSSIGYVYLLMPQKTGTLTIPGASITADGKSLHCASTTVHVSNQSSGNSSSNSAGGGGMSGLQSLLDQLSAGDGAQTESSNVLHKGESAAQKIKDNMFIRANPNKKTVYVGEPFYVTYQLYSALGGQSKVVGQPSFTGVSVLDLTKEESQPQTVTIGNKQYRSFLIRRVQLTALHPGPVSLGTVETANDVPFTSYDDPYHPQTYTENIKNPSTNIEAKPLPEAGKPVNFSGAIGHFQIHVVPQRIASPAGENNILHVEITGDGNLLPANMPEIKWPAGVEHYDPKDSQNVDKRNIPVVVSKVFEIPFIGDKQGKATFEPISFTYFDPTKGSYQTIQSDPFTVDFTAPLPKDSVTDNSFGNNVIGVAKTIVAILLGILILLWFVKVLKNKQKSNVVAKNKVSDNAKMDESAPWNIENKAKVTMEEKPKEVQQLSSESSVKSEIIDKKEEPLKKNFQIELQKIMLTTNKSEMYALGSALIVDILSAYLHTSQQSKDQLVNTLKISSKPTSEKDSILQILQSLQEYINRGLYNPFFNESDKIVLIDRLNDLLHITKL